MYQLIKGIFFSILIWIIVKISEKTSDGRKIQINNRLLYAFIWIWHSYGKISILGLLCAIGVQITDIIFIILFLFFSFSKEFVGECWILSLIGVLFVSGGIGIIDTAKECKRCVTKVVMVLISILVLFTALYFVSPMVKYIF